MTSKKLAFITGITGQDGSYLAELLLSKDYEVHGLVRRSSNHQNLGRIQPILSKLVLHTGDMTDTASIQNALQEVWHQGSNCSQFEIYNLAAQSHVHQSFTMPEYTAKVDGLAPLSILEWIRSQRAPNIRFYQASTSELFGKVLETPQSETTPFYPRSPYSIAKLYAYWIVRNYRESYNLFAVNGILFNHESPRRGEDFVTRKITKGFATMYLHDTVLEIGNLDARRDWGHARDYVEGMWRMLQQDSPDDFILGTGHQHSVKDFIEIAYPIVFPGHTLSWEGDGLTEKGYDSQTRQLRVQVNPDFFRPAEVQTLLANPSKAKIHLNWTATTSFNELVREMVEADCSLVK
jgi:GDPmannose 4,6-dehydratase